MEFDFTLYLRMFDLHVTNEIIRVSLIPIVMCSDILLGNVLSFICVHIPIISYSFPSVATKE